MNAETMLMYLRTCMPATHLRNMPLKQEYDFASQSQEPKSGPVVDVLQMHHNLTLQQLMQYHSCPETPTVVLLADLAQLIKQRVVVLNDDNTFALL